MTPEEKLWRAVVSQAFTDATGKGDLLTILSEAEREQAISFFEARGDWYRAFYQICCMADLDPDYVKWRYKNAKKRGGIDSESFSGVAKTTAPKRKSGGKPKRKQPTCNRHGDGYRGARY
jgi:hypothetical protein